MVVTNGIERAVQYFHAIRDYLKERKSPYKAIVAFSGEHEFGGKPETEASLNGFPSAKIEERFREHPYRFLVCADKFQTGYDEAYRNARKNSDKENARVEHDRALLWVMTSLMKDDTPPAPLSPPGRTEPNDSLRKLAARRMQERCDPWFPGTAGRRPSHRTSEKTGILAHVDKQDRR